MTSREIMECVILSILLVGSIGSTYMLIKLVIESIKNAFREDHGEYIDII